jgi:hypothetical protein
LEERVKQELRRFVAQYAETDLAKWDYRAPGDGGPSYRRPMRTGPAFIDFVHRNRITGWADARPLTMDPRWWIDRRVL